MNYAKRAGETSIVSLPCIGDFEASGLGPESYPIEAAWSLPNGDIRSHLIRPDASWPAYWDPNAEALHHITYEIVINDGLPAAAVAAEMNRDLAKATVYFDGEEYDRYWLTQLYAAAGLKPAFRFGDFNALLRNIGDWDGNRHVVSEARARADIRNLPLHRTANDVRFLQRWYIHTRDMGSEG